MVTFTNNSGGPLVRNAWGVSFEMGASIDAQGPTGGDPLADGASLVMSMTLTQAATGMGLASSYTGTLDYEITCLNGTPSGGGGGGSSGSSGLSGIVLDKAALAYLDKYFGGMTAEQYGVVVSELAAGAGVTVSEMHATLMRAFLRNYVSGRLSVSDLPGFSFAERFQMALADSGTGNIIQPGTFDTGAVNFDAQSFSNLDRNDKDVGYRAMIGAAQFANKVIANPSADTSGWVNAGLSYANESAAGVGYYGTIFGLSGGVDHRFTPRLVAGMMLGYESTRINTRYNLGELDGDGFSVGPYVAYELQKGLTLNGSATYARTNFDVTAFNGTSTGQYDANRYSLSTGVSGNYRNGAWRYRPDITVTYVLQDQDGYTDSLGITYADAESDLGRLSGGGQIGYAFKNGAGEIEPYGTVRGEVDFIRPDKIILGGGRTYQSQAAGAVVGAGVNLFSLGSGINGNLEATYDGVFRDTYNGATIQGTISGSF